MLLDLRLAFRLLARHFTISATIIVLIAAGVVVNTALFSIVDGVLLKPLPVSTPSRLVVIGQSRPAAAGAFVPLSPRLFRELEERAAFAGVAAMTPADSSDANAAAQEQGLRAERVSTGFFDVLGVRPLLGRALERRDELLPDPVPVVIGHDVWVARLASDRGILNKTVSLNGRRVTVVGVMPAGFDFPRGAMIWEPLRLTATPDQENFEYLEVIGRLPATRGGVATVLPGFVIRTLNEHFSPQGTFQLAFVLAVAGVVLLVTWVQVATLQMSRAADRAREIGVRIALGAGRPQLLRQLVVEGAVIAGAALAVSWLLTPPATTMMLRLLPPELVRGHPIAPDVRAFAFACGVSVLGILVFALTPARAVLRTAPADAVRGVPRGTITRGSVDVRTCLLVLQTAITVTMLYHAGLATRSFARITAMDLGLRPDGLVAFRFPVDDPTSRRPFVSWPQLLAARSALARHPAVSRTAAASSRPLGYDRVRIVVSSDASASRSGQAALLLCVTPDFFRTTGLPILEGRNLSEGQNGVVVNRTLARSLAGDRPVLGLRVRVLGLPFHVVGIVPDAAVGGPDQPATAQIYVPADRLFPPRFLLVRIRGESRGALPQLQAMLQSAWRSAEPPAITDFQAEVRRLTAPYRSRLVLLAALALVGLALSAIGIHAAIAYDTRRRTREMAIRIALGADPGGLQYAVVTGALARLGVGVALGLGLGMAGGRWAASLLYDVRPVDAATIAAVTVLLIATGVLASARPARRAAAVDPAVALRDE